MTVDNVQMEAMKRAGEYLHKKQTGRQRAHNRVTCWLLGVGLVVWMIIYYILILEV